MRLWSSVAYTRNSIGVLILTVLLLLVAVVVLVLEVEPVTPPLPVIPEVEEDEAEVDSDVAGQFHSLTDPGVDDAKSDPVLCQETLSVLFCRW